MDREPLMIERLVTQESDVQTFNIGDVKVVTPPAPAVTDRACNEELNALIDVSV